MTDSKLLNSKTSPDVILKNEPIHTLIQNKLDEKTVLRNRINEILEKHNWRESDVPMNSEYWDLCNQFRTLINNSVP